MKTLFLLLMGWALAITAAAQPANDDPCGAVLISPSGGVCTPFADNAINSTTSVFNASTTAGFTSYNFNCDATPNDSMKDIWFKLALDSTNRVIKFIPIPGFDISFHVYYRQSGTCGTNDLELTPIICVNDGGPGDADSVVIPYYYGAFYDTLYFRVFHAPDGTGPTPVGNSQFSVCAYAPVPGCTANSFPSNGSSFLDAPSITWGFTPNSSSYDVYLGATAASAALIGNTINSNFDISVLNLAAGTYFWYVVPKNGSLSPSGCSASATSFTMLPKAPNDLICNAVLLTPGNGICTPYSDPNTNSTTSYHDATHSGGQFGNGVPCTTFVSILGDVWFRFTSPDSAFYMIKVNPVAGINTSYRVYEAATDCTGSSFTNRACFNTGGVGVTDSGIFVCRTGKEYYVQVFSASGGRETLPSGNSQFSICLMKSPPFCVNPLLISPANGASGIDHLSSSLSWNTVPGAIDYDLYIGSSAATMAKVDYTVLVSTSTTQTLRFKDNYVFSSPFFPNTQYFWKVVPRNGIVINTGCPEDIRSFTTAACPPTLSLTLDEKFAVSGVGTGELDYVIACPNCPPSWLVLEYGPAGSAGIGTNPAPGNFIIYPAELKTSANAIPGHIGLDSPQLMNTYRYRLRVVGSCPNSQTILLPFAGGNDIVVSPCTQTSINIQEYRGRWNFNGQYPVNSNGNKTAGKMAWFNFTPTESAVYYLQVDSVETNELIDYLYKPDSLNKYSATNWTGISEINSKGKYAIGYLHAGVLYRFVADRENDSVVIKTLVTPYPARHFITICKAVPSAVVTNSCIAANIRKPVPANSPKEEFALDENGNLVASLRTNSDSLGLVTVSCFVNSNGLRFDAGGREYLDRNFTITPAMPATTTQQVKLYFTNTELTNLINAPNDGLGDVNGINDLEIVKTGQACNTSASLNLAGAVKMPATARGAYDLSASFVNVPVNSFSSFYLQGPGSTPLPLSLLYFSAIKNKQVVNLSWKTENEFNVDLFELEKSRSGNDFTRIATIQAGNNPAGQPYSFDDTRPFPDDNYYRLKLIDKNGIHSYSPIRHIGQDASEPVRLYPTTTSSFITITGISAGTLIRIVDISGRLLFAQVASSTIQRIDLKQFTSAIYFIEVKSGQQRGTTFKVIRE